jgi:hypothetical protein
MFSRFQPVPPTSAGGSRQPSADLPYRAADAHDYWFRHLIEGRGNTIRQGRVQALYLQRTFKPPVAQRPWALELSGRMLSLATDIRQKAQATASELSSRSTRVFEFHHVAYANVGMLRDRDGLDVFVERIQGDPAHANFVILEPLTPVPQLSPADRKQTHQIFRDIAALLELCDAADLTPLKSLRLH